MRKHAKKKSTSYECAIRQRLRTSAGDFRSRGCSVGVGGGVQATASAAFRAHTKITSFFFLFFGSPFVFTLLFAVSSTARALFYFLSSRYFLYHIPSPVCCCSLGFGGDFCPKKNLSCNEKRARSLPSCCKTYFQQNTAHRILLWYPNFKPPSLVGCVVFLFTLGNAFQFFAPN